MDKIKGLGDVLFIITKYTGIRWIVKKIWGEDCGCDERQDFLNEKFNFTKEDLEADLLKKPKPTPKL